MVAIEKPNGLLLELIMMQFKTLLLCELPSFPGFHQLFRQLANESLGGGPREQVSVNHSPEAGGPQQCPCESSLAPAT